MNKLKTILLAAILLISVGLASATTLSVSDIEYDSNADHFNGELIAIQLTADDSTETLQTTVTSDQISDQITGEVDQDIEISIIENDRSVEYGMEVAPSKRNIQEGQVIYEEGFDTESDAMDWVSDNCGFSTSQGTPYIVTDYFNYYKIDWKAWCVAETDYLANTGEFREDSTSPRSQFEVTYQLDIEGETSDTATLTNNDVGDGVSTSLGQNTRIQWIGNFDLGTSPEGTSSGALALQHNTFNDGWRVGNTDDYNNYNSYIENNLPSDLADVANNYKDDSDLEDALNTRASNAASPYHQHTLSEGRVTEDGIESGTLEYTPESDLFHPNFMIYIDAGDHDSNALTINRPAGLPAILSVDGDTAGEYQSGEIDVMIQNVGDYEGQFATRVTSCSSDFDFDDTTRTSNLDSGETTTESFHFSFDSQSSEETVTGSCDVEVQEVTSLDTQTDSVEVEGEQASQCNEGETSPTVVDGQEAVVECTDGINQNVVEVCGDEETTEHVDGDWQCVDEETIIDDPTLFDRITQPFTDAANDIRNALGGGLGTIQTVSMLISGITTFVVAAYTFGVSYSKVFSATQLDKVQALPEQSARLVFASVMTLMAGWAVYTLISSIVVQALILVGVVAGSYLYMQSKGLISAAT